MAITDEQFLQLQSELEKTKMQLSSVEATSRDATTVLAQELDALKSEIKIADSKVEQLNQIVSGNIGTIAALSKQATSMKNDLAIMADRVSKLDSTTGTVINDVNSIHEEVDLIHTEIADLQAADVGFKAAGQQTSKSLIKVKGLANQGIADAQAVALRAETLQTQVTELAIEIETLKAA